MDIGLLLLRLVVGLVIASHGAQKLFGWFGGYGIAGTGQWMESIGFRPGRLHATVSGLAELLGGLSLVLGLFTPLGSALVVCVMLVALFSVHWPNFYMANNGMEFVLVLLVAAVAPAFTGAGVYSLDATIGIDWAGVDTGFGALLLGAAAAMLALVGRALTRPAEART